jgi:hypothetical protein
VEYEDIAQWEQFELFFKPIQRDKDVEELDKHNAIDDVNDKSHYSSTNKVF